MMQWQAEWQCALFDLDGTLVASEQLNCQAYLDLIPEITDTLDVLIARYEGQKFAHTLRDIERRYQVRLPDDFEGQYRQHLQGLFASELLPVAGVPELLRVLPVPCGVASNAPEQKIQQALKVTGLAPHFGENVFSAYTVNAWKPAPDLFLHAAAQMGFAAEQCVVFEDSAPGVAAAQAAGMAVIHYQPQGERVSRAGYECIQNMHTLVRALS